MIPGMNAKQMKKMERQMKKMGMDMKDLKGVKEVIIRLEDKELVAKNMYSDKSGINVYIGDENDFDKDVTIVKAKYHRNGEEGTIAVVGPKRMEYDKVVGLLQYISENINDDEGKND